MAEKLLVPAIVGLGYELGSRIVTNTDMDKILEARLGAVDKLSERFGTGIKARRWRGEGQTLTSMAVNAVIDASVMADIGPRRLNQVIMASATQSYQGIPEAPQIQDKLGLPFLTETFDVVGACAGWLKGMRQAFQGLTSPYGVSGPQAVIGGEILSVFIDPSKKTSFTLFADGVGSAIVDLVEPDDEKNCLMPVFEGGSAGEYIKAIMAEAGGSIKPASYETVENKEHVLGVDGPIVGKQAPIHMATLARRVLDKAQLELGEVDLFVPHQANLGIMLATANELGFCENQVFSNISNIGNTSAASIPIALTQAWEQGRLRRNDKVLMASFGAGFVSSACVMQMVGLPRR